MGSPATPVPTLDSKVSDFIRSMNHKINFMKKAFVDPYFDKDDIDTIQSGMNLFPAKDTTEGLLRISYTYPGGETIPNMPNDTNAMTRVFFPASGAALMRATNDGTMVLSSIKDYSLIQEGGTYHLYEYLGTLFVPKDGDYYFGLNTTGAAEVFLNNDLLLSRYTGGAAFSPDERNPPITTPTAKPLKMGEYSLKIRFYQKTAQPAPGVAATTVDRKLNLLWKATAADPYTTIGCDHLFYDATLMNRTSLVSTFDENAFVQNIMDYNRFVKYFGVMTPSFRSNIKGDSYLSKIHVSTDRNPYSPYVCATGAGRTATSIPTGDLATDPNTSIPYVNGDINYHAFLGQLMNESNGNYLAFLQKKMDEVRCLYNALDDDAYENYKANPSMTNLINGYAIGSTRKPDQKPISDILTSSMMDKLSKVTPVERFVLRRILLIIDLVAHAHISMMLFETVYEATTGSKLACESSIMDMVLHFMTRLKTLNANYNAMFESADGQIYTHNEIMNQLYVNIHQFNKNTDRMTTLSKDYRTSKLNLKSNLKKMDAENRVYSTAKKLALAFMIVTIIVLATLVAYGILAKVKPEMKWIGAGMVAVLSFVVVLVIYLVKSKKMEGFDAMYNIADLRSKLQTATAIQTIREAYIMDVIHQISTYIHNTIHMALILQNSKTYNYINHNLQKEINYYSMSKGQVDNASVLAKSSSRMYSLETKNHSSRVNVYIALIIILTVTIIGYVMAGDNKAFQYIILGIAGVLLFMVALLYIIDVERKVRTDGKKYYWGQPTTMLDKL